MEQFIADLVKRFESGQLDRRDFCQGVALAATVYAAGPANAQAPAPASRCSASITSPTPAPTTPRHATSTPRYSALRTSRKRQGQAREPYVRAGARQGRLVPDPAHGADPGQPRPPAEAQVDHICFTMSNWNEDAVRAAMKAKGHEISGGRPGSLHVLDPFGYDVQFANIIEEDPFKHGRN